MKNNKLRSTSDANIYWIIDVVSSILSSPRWEAEVLSFVDEQCIIFDCEEENKFQYSSVHQEFVNLVDNVLRERLIEFGISEKDLGDACLIYNEKCKESNEGGAASYSGKLDNSVIEQIRAMGDFQGFKNMMLKRNMELQIEAMEALKNINGCCKKLHNNINFVEEQDVVEVAQIESAEKFDTNDCDHSTIDKILNFSNMMVNDPSPDISSLLPPLEKEVPLNIEERSKKDEEEDGLQLINDQKIEGQRACVKPLNSLSSGDVIHSNNDENKSKVEEETSLSKEKIDDEVTEQEDSKGQTTQTQREDIQRIITHCEVEICKETNFGRSKNDEGENIEKQEKGNVSKKAKGERMVSVDNHLIFHFFLSGTTKAKKQKNIVINEAATLSVIILHLKKETRNYSFVPSLLPPPIDIRGKRANESTYRNNNYRKSDHHNQSLVTMSRKKSNIIENAKKVQAIERHDKFRKAKYDKSMSEDKEDLNRKRREYHLKQQRDLIVMKRNEMRRKEAAASTSPVFPSLLLEATKNKSEHDDSNRINEKQGNIIDGISLSSTISRIFDI